jgi:hypothetical protein
MSKFVLSSSEHKILLVLGMLICVLYCADRAARSINYSNYRVAQEQKLKRGDNGKTGSIEIQIDNVCYMGAPIYITILQFQFMTLFVILFNLWKLKEGRISDFLTAFSLSTINLSCYLLWIYGSYVGRIGNENFRIGGEKLHTYLMIDSTFYEFLIFMSLIFLFTTQTLFLLRFLLDRFSAKLS